MDVTKPPASAGLLGLLARIRRVESAIPSVTAPLADFLLRLSVAAIFFRAGLTKLPDFEKTVALFADEYQVPVLPPVVAAALGTAAELVCPVLLAVGLLSRWAAAPLLCMALVIQFVLGGRDPASYSRDEHYLWIAILLAIVARGAGAWSLDAAIDRRIGR